DLSSSEWPRCIVSTSACYCTPRVSPQADVLTMHRGHSELERSRLAVLDRRRLPMSLHKVAGIVVVLICGSVAHAGPRSEPSRAATVYQVTLMYRLGVAYDEGLGVQSDSAAAYRWYSLAAAQGHAESM